MPGYCSLSTTFCKEGSLDPLGYRGRLLRGDMMVEDDGDIERQATESSLRLVREVEQATRKRLEEEGCGPDERAQLLRELVGLNRTISQLEKMQREGH
jgi:hypothetical protein